MISVYKQYGIIAGIFAANGSFFGKALSKIDDLIGISNTYESNATSIVLKAICFSLMLVCNAMVWRFFVKALHETDGSISATVKSVGTNYCLTAAFGVLFFGEETTFRWWCGTGIIIFGLALILSNDSNIRDREVPIKPMKIKKS